MGGVGGVDAVDGCCAARRAAAAAAAAAAARRSSRWWISVFTCEFRLLTSCCCWATSACTRLRSAARLATSFAATARWCLSTAWRAATSRSAFRTWARMEDSVSDIRFTKSIRFTRSANELALRT